MDSEMSKERRKGGQRRHCDSGPPPGIAERRINIERRLFNLGVNCSDAWQGFRFGDKPGDSLLS
jgi:hypothetical protein